MEPTESTSRLNRKRPAKSKRLDSLKKPNQPKSKVTRVSKSKAMETEARTEPQKISENQIAVMKALRRVGLPQEVLDSSQAKAEEALKAGILKAQWGLAKVHNHIPWKKIEQGKRLFRVIRSPLSKKGR